MPLQNLSIKVIIFFQIVKQFNLQNILIYFILNIITPRVVFIDPKKVYYIPGRSLTEIYSHQSASTIELVKMDLYCEQLLGNIFFIKK